MAFAEKIEARRARCGQMNESHRRLEMIPSTAAGTIEVELKLGF